MPFPVSVVGSELEKIEQELTTRSILAYAAGVGAVEPEFLDDARPDRLVALPFQCVSLEWPSLLSVRRALIGLRSDEALRAVHAAQHSVFHRAMRLGDVLVTTPQLVSARRLAAGVLAIIRLETRCRWTDEPITTSWSSSIYRNVELDGPEVEMAAPPAPSIEVTTPLPRAAESIEIPISRGLPHVYSECAGIWNPIHTERTVALSTGLPDIILHGTATWALAGLALIRRYADSDAVRLKSLSGRFSGMVVPGQPIVMRHADIGGAVHFEVTVQSGAVAISRGVATFD